MQHLIEMFQAGGSKALTMGLAGILCTAWGIYQFRRPPQKRSRVLHLICSTTPALLGLWVFYRMFSAYLNIAQSTVAPTKEEFDLWISHAIILGSLSILCTALPVGLAIVGLIRNQNPTGLTT